jgi:hypothetical protein
MAVWFLFMTTDVTEFQGSSVQEERRRRKENGKSKGEGTMQLF